MISDIEAKAWSGEYLAKCAKFVRATRHILDNDTSAEGQAKKKPVRIRCERCCYLCVDYERKERGLSVDESWKGIAAVMGRQYS